MAIKTEAQKSETRAADLIGTLVVLNRGNTMIDASRELQAIIDAIVDTNKPGELIIKLKIKPSGYDKRTMRTNLVEFDPEITAKIPRHDQGKSSFFLTDDNLLTREDPAQSKMFEE